FEPRRRGARLTARLGGIDWLTPNLRLYRVGNEAFVVSLVMHRLDVAYGRRRIADEVDSRMERDLRHGQFAGGIPGHNTFGIVNVAVDAESALRCDGEEPEHMTT